ncbi:MAG: hypothetical protein HOP18_10335 [Deltaproteobacteria bacterium]|nr:hypothetical protein [Deltaproteobacteria bacterium]
MNNPSGTILKADPRLQRVAWVTVTVLIGCGAFGILFLREFLAHIEALTAHAPEERIQQLITLLKILLVIKGISFIGFGTFSAQRALRTIHTDQFPPPGTRVIRDTLVVTGRAAQRHGKGLLVLSVVVITSGIVVPIFTWRMLDMFSP